MKSPKILRLVVASVAFLTGLVASAQVAATAPYTVSVFTTSIPGVDFAPDSIAVLDGHVFVGYGDGAAPDGSDGKTCDADFGGGAGFGHRGFDGCGYGNGEPARDGFHPEVEIVVIV